MSATYQVSAGIMEGREYAATACAVTADHKTAVCTVAPGVADQLKWTIFIGGQSSKEATTSYAPPNITRVGVVSGPGSTMGGDTIRVEGHDFGRAQDHVTDANASALAVRYGPTGTEFGCANQRLVAAGVLECETCLLYTSPSPRDS